MSESSENEARARGMEWKQQPQYQTSSPSAKGVVSTSQKSGSGREPVPRGKGQWRDKPRRGRYGPPPNQDRFPSRGGYGARNQYGQLQQQGPATDSRSSSRGGNQYRGRKDVAKSNGLEGFVDGPAIDTPGNNGGKKNGNSLNYLLNFKYEPRERLTERRMRSGSRRRTSFNKELFLQANCQFIVSDAADYTIYAMEPDMLVDWKLIEQVRIFSHGVPSCPICLFPPTAAKITRCGHVYCWPCILHYLSLGDKSWRKCPICYESITKTDLKSVMAMESKQFAVGQKITMRLMKRAKNSTLVLPSSQWKERDLTHFRLNDTVDTRFTKLLLASPEDIIQQVIAEEEIALAAELSEAVRDQTGEECFIESALLELKTRRQDLSNRNKSVEEISSLLKSTSLESEDDVDVTASEPDNGWNVVLSEPSCIQSAAEYDAAFSDDEEVSSPEKEVVHQPSDEESLDIAGADETSEEMTPESCPPGEVTDAKASVKRREDIQTSAVTSPQENYYYFYQAEDGQNIFLHPINARCLLNEYGSLENSPEVIEAEIKEMEPLSQTEDLRKRYRYLSYLPLTCEFVMCELDLKPPILSKATLEFFREELQKRKQRRQKKMKMEKKRDHKVAMKVASMEGRPIGRRPGQSINLSCDVEFPAQVGPLVLSPLTSRPGPFTQLAEASAYSSDEGSMIISVNTDESVQQPDSIWGSPPSFAQALRAGKAVESFKPAKKSEQSKGSGATPKRAGATASDDSDEDYIPPPTFQSTFSDALSAAVAQGLEQHLRAAATSDQAVQGGKGKKQKKKKKLLFTTGHLKYN